MLHKALRILRHKFPYRIHRRPTISGLPNALASHLEPYKGSQLTLIDIGAHTGEFTRSIDAFCGVAKGLLIEAQPEKAETLREQFKEPRFKVINCAACEREGTIELEINHYDPTTSILKTRRALNELSAIDVSVREKVNCRCVRLDDIAPKEDFPKVDLIKLDVQGAEHLVLRGAAQTLRRTKLIWTEVSFFQLYENSSLFSDIHSHLRTNGFLLGDLSPAFRSPRGELLQADALFYQP